MRILIIGAAGFVGKHLIEHINQDLKWEIHATKLVNEKLDNDKLKTHDLDIRDFNAVNALLLEVKPDYIIHLAAQSSVALSWKEPNLTVDINIKGSINVLNALKELKLKTRLLLIGSGEEYGKVKVEDNPINEENKLYPGNIYAVTKATQNMIAKIYADAYDLDIVMVRAFNHIGPGQLPMFVVSDFCKQVANIEKGLHEPKIHVGNLSAKRDFTDVRDVVKAYTSLLTKGLKNELYNVGSGKSFLIEDILKEIINQSNQKIEIILDPLKVRPLDVPEIVADISKITRDTNWAPSIQLSETIKDTITYWRNFNENN